MNVRSSLASQSIPYANLREEVARVGWVGLEFMAQMGHICPQILGLLLIGCPPDLAQELALVTTLPAWRTSVARSWYSLGVRCISAPDTNTCRRARSTCSSPVENSGSSGWPACSACRRATRILARSSPTPKGLVR